MQVSARALTGLGALRIALETVPVAVVLSGPIAPGPAGFRRVDGAGPVVVGRTFVGFAAAGEGACTADMRVGAVAGTLFALVLLGLAGGEDISVPACAGRSPSFISDTSLSVAFRC